MTVYMVAQVQILDPDSGSATRRSLGRKSPVTAGGTWRAAPARRWKKPIGTSRKTCRSIWWRSQHGAGSRMVHFT